jgi:hypothetical protein
MWAVVAGLIAAGVVLGSARPAAAAPPDDIAAYCRTLHPQAPFQIRCLNLENAAAARVGRIGPGPDPEGWNRCRAMAASWTAMEQCLATARAAAAAGGGPPGAPGAPGGGGPVERAPTGPAQPGGQPGDAPPAAGSPPPSPAPGAPPSSTVILGPQPGPALPGERTRQTRVIPEADADRQLRSVLERNPSARCTKKQYGPGWVITCE